MTQPPDVPSSLRAGIRAARGVAAVMVPISITFGALARTHGWGTIAPIAFSLLTFSGGAQFAAAGVLAAGGGVVSAVISGAVLNLRFIPMAIGASGALRGGPLRRAIEAQTIVDASWVLASRGDGTFDRGILIGGAIPQYVMWVSGTAVGAIIGSHLGDPSTYGLDAVFPAFFLVLLAGELRDTRRRLVAVGAGALTLILISFVPPGLPVVAACGVALLATRRPQEATAP